MIKAKPKGAKAAYKKHEEVEPKGTHKSDLKVADDLKSLSDHYKTQAVAFGSSQYMRNKYGKKK